MKRNGLIVAMLVCVLIIGSTFAAFGAAVEDVRAQVRPDFTIVIDGVTQSFFNAQSQAVYPLVYDGTTYLPVRAIGEIMGKNTNWDEANKTITLSGTKNSRISGDKEKNPEIQKVWAELRPDFTIIIDGKTSAFKDQNGDTVYPLLYEGTTYLPIRAIGQIMGKTVDWDSKTNTVTLGTGSTTVTDADSFNTGSQTSKPDQTKPDKPSWSEDDRYIGESNAEKIARDKANNKNAAVVKCKLDYDDGRAVYEIELRDGRTEYDFEIDAVTGKIVEWDVDYDD